MVGSQIIFRQRGKTGFLGEEKREKGTRVRNEYSHARKSKETVPIK